MLSPSQPIIKSEKREQYFSEAIKSAPEIDPSNVTALALDINESILYYIDKKNQLFKVEMNLAGPRVEQSISKYVNCPYHGQVITGMDICLRKPLIVTCSEKVKN